jgi:SNF2 family DNA or RNA helicase
LLEEACRQRQIPEHGLAGQTQTVNAYRLISPGTVEEKIWELQQSKAQTIADVLGEEGFARSLTKNNLEYLFAED